jgi:hypothetical protein
MKKIKLLWLKLLDWRYGKLVQGGLYYQYLDWLYDRLCHNAQKVSDEMDRLITKSEKKLDRLASRICILDTELGHPLGYYQEEE